jgi:hypothetical protein
VAPRRPNLNRAIRALLRHVAKTLPELSYIKPSKILVVAGEARRASRGTVKPLAFKGGRRVGSDGRRKPMVKVRNKRMLYCVTLRPLFFRRSTARQRIETLLHELYHISPQFDGTLDPRRRHARGGETFTEGFAPLLKQYLKTCPAEIWAPFAYDGEVRIQMWLERPSSFFYSGQSNGRRIYTEDQLFVGPVRMMTKRAHVH